MTLTELGFVLGGGVEVDVGGCDVGFSWKEESKALRASRENDGSGGREAASLRSSTSVLRSATIFLC